MNLLSRSKLTTHKFHSQQLFHAQLKVMAFEATGGLWFLRNLDVELSSNCFFVESYNSIDCWWVRICQDCFCYIISTLPSKREIFRPIRRIIYIQKYYYRVDMVNPFFFFSFFDKDGVMIINLNNWKSIEVTRHQELKWFW